jgi:hypothetical protein
MADDKTNEPKKEEVKVPTYLVEGPVLVGVINYLKLRPYNEVAEVVRLLEASRLVELK